MLKKLKTLYTVYRKERYAENAKALINKVTGISQNEVERILKEPHNCGGKTTLFDHNFYYSHGAAFIHSLQEIFEEEVYKFTTYSKEPYIIDCGANVGLSVYYFKKNHPNAHIVAFEPDQDVFELLEKNVGIIDNNNSIQIKKEAVWMNDGEISFYSEGGVAGSAVTDYSKKNNKILVKAIDLKKYLCKPVDFLKIDIEGAENELIFNIATHLHYVKNFFLEYHGITGNSQNLGDVLNLLKDCGFQYYIRLAADPIKFPYCDTPQSSFNQQLNIFCYRR